MSSERIAAVNEAVRPKREDLCLEALHTLGGGYQFAERPLPHPVPGTVCLMDILGLPWIKGEKIDDIHIRAAKVLLEYREDAVGIVMEAVNCADPVDSVAKMDTGNLNDTEIAIAGKVIDDSMRFAATGFNFFPKGAEESGSDLSFGSEFIAGICRVLGELSVPPFRAIWREPLARVGFIMATVAKANGVKSIGRENTLDWEKAWKAFGNINDDTARDS